VPYGEPGDYAGPDLLAAWYQRNIRIYHNIVKLVDSPNDRILVIYGAGHLGWLQQDIANDATVKLRKLDDLTGKQ
jgi:pheromone shutdown protein TraB